MLCCFYILVVFYSLLFEFIVDTICSIYDSLIVHSKIYIENLLNNPNYLGC